MAGVELLFGPMLIGVLLNMALYGVMSIQMFAYYQRYTNDSAWIRCFMLYLFIVQTANIFVEVGIIYEPLIVRYGKEVALLVTPKLLPGDSVLIAVTSAPVQLFTAWRISVITRSFIVPVLIALLSLASFGGGIFVSIMVTMKPAFKEFGDFTTHIIFWLVCSAVTDVVIAVAMSHALYTRKTGFGAVDGQINRIIRLTVETGAVTALTALADVLLFLLFPRTTVNFIVDFPLSNLYTCSVLAMLNSRDRKKSNDPEHAQTVPQMFTPQNSHANHLQPRPSFHVTKTSQMTKVEVFTSTEKLVAIDSSDVSSERSFASNPDFYNYNPPRTQNVGKPRASQLELRPKTIVALDGSIPQRF